MNAIDKAYQSGVETCYLEKVGDVGERIVGGLGGALAGTIAGRVAGHNLSRPSKGLFSDTNNQERDSLIGALAGGGALGALGAASPLLGGTIGGASLGSIIGRYGGRGLGRVLGDLRTMNAAENIGNLLGVVGGGVAGYKGMEALRGAEKTSSHIGTGERVLGGLGGALTGGLTGAQAGLDLTLLEPEKDTRYGLIGGGLGALGGGALGAYAPLLGGTAGSGVLGGALGNFAGSEITRQLGRGNDSDAGGMIGKLLGTIGGGVAGYHGMKALRD